MSGLLNRIAELPLYIPIAVAIVGGILVYSAGGEKKIRVVGASLCIAALLLLGLSWMLESDREIVERKTNEMVKAVSSKDWDRFPDYFHEKAHILLFDTRDSIAKAVKFNCERINLQSAKLTSSKSVENGDEWVVTFHVTANADSFSNIQTDWEAQWIKTDKEWVISEIRPLGGFGVTADDLAGWIKSKF
jgi:hypothetical protein